MTEDSQLRHTVRRLISRASELKHRRMHELLSELGLHRGEPWVLYALWEQDGIPQSALTERVNRSPSTITKTVQRMEKAGFVARCPDPHDERVSRVCLTEAGRDIRPAVEEVWQRLDQQVFSGFSVQELAMLHDLLARICRNFETRS
jgi:DNA-binding MarR family transcriptional regulator